MTVRSAIVLGATSGIAGHLVRELAERGAALVLVARDREKLAAAGSDARARGAQVETLVRDLSDVADPRAAMIDMATLAGGSVDAVFVLHGALGDQAEAQADAAAARASIEANFTSAALWCEGAAALLETQGRGRLVVAGSVAGDRGRRANYVYGAAKAGIAALVEGVDHRLAPKGARAVVAKIGPTRTPMTEHMDRSGKLWSDPEDVAKGLLRAAERGGPVVYLPWWWRFVMAGLRNAPSAVFNKLDL